MTTIIMSIKRRHIRNMALGIKYYELRKSVPRVREGEWCRVLLCESGSGGKITGEFIMDAWCDMTKVKPEELARLACITAAEADGYRKKGTGKLYGWRVTRFRAYPMAGRPIHIRDIGLSRPPQSWQYVRATYGSMDIS